VKVIQRSEKETRERNGEKQLQKETVTASPCSPSGTPVVSEEDETTQEAHPDLMTLRVAYTTLSHQLALLDVNKQAGQRARLYRQVQAAEARLRLAEQNTPPSQSSPSEFATRFRQAAIRVRQATRGTSQQGRSDHTNG